jgi:16S rRNA (uracil1498-N3)-methyltransferase
MPIHDFAAQRLFVDIDLAAGASIACAAPQAHYLRNVLRLPDGSEVRIFNGVDGEWRAMVRHDGRRGVLLEAIEQTRQQDSGPDLDFLFAPLKRSRLDYVVQKATELGVARIQPVMTERVVAERVNLDRLDANIIEAAEQCGVLRVPDLDDTQELTAVLDAWPGDRRLIFCDEAAPVADPIRTLAALPRGPMAVLIGPEGGFSEAERGALQAKPFVTTLSLGPRMLRADTAAVAALTLVNAVAGDWAPVD